MSKGFKPRPGSDSSSSFESLGELTHLSKPWFAQLWNGDINTYLAQHSMEIKEILHVKPLLYLTVVPWMLLSRKIPPLNFLIYLLFAFPLMLLFLPFLFFWQKDQVFCFVLFIFYLKSSK